MKKSFILLLLPVLFLFYSCSKQSSEPKFTVDPNPVIKQAIENKKNLIVVFESETCQYCDKLNREVLKDMEVKQSLIKNNIEIAIVNVDGKRKVSDPEGKKEVDEQTLAGIYRVTGYPTIAVFLPDKDYELYGVIPGYIPKNYFIMLSEFIGSKCYQKVDSFQKYVENGGKCWFHRSILVKIGFP